MAAHENITDVTLLCRDCLAANLHSYLARWKEYTKYQRNKQATSLVDGSYRLYRSLLIHSFLKWKDQASQKRTAMMRKKIEGLEEQGRDRERLILQCRQQ